MQTGAINPIAKWVLIAGIGTVILFSSGHRNPVIRVLVGLNASLGIVQLFADVLSYLRLFALGLATMYMCQTFNLLGNMVYEGVPYVGFFPAALVLIAGHAINIVLGIMGGVVHGLRLNFLEWYRWCFEGDGLAFKPFRKVATG
jgi:V/A-type H+/Na+-transporting ATPase subunit I